jgi:hypothetical protein
MHDLTRLHADELCRHHDGPPHQQALVRLLGRYHATADAANNHLGALSLVIADGGHRGTGLVRIGFTVHPRADIGSPRSSGSTSAGSAMPAACHVLRSANCCCRSLGNSRKLGHSVMCSGASTQGSGG